MTLHQIWKENPDQIRDKRVDQIIVFAGDGKLGDKNSAPEEFRTFLSRVPADWLARYADDCLTSSFRDSGLALESQLEGMNQTHREDGRSYWHVQIHLEGNRWVLHRRKNQSRPDITDLMLLSHG